MTHISIRERGTEPGGDATPPAAVAAVLGVTPAEAEALLGSGT
jgi:hypothetical protein